MDDGFALIPLSGEARRQYINARETFMAERAAEREARQFEGGMRWRSRNDCEYLTRVFKRGASKSLGLRSSETEAMYQAFCVKQAALSERLAHLRERLVLHSKLNRAYSLHYVDTTTVRILRGLSSAGVDEALRVVGGSALLAYQFLAGVRIRDDRSASGHSAAMRMPTKRLSLVASEQLCSTQLHGILSKIDKSFVLEGRGEVLRAFNKARYEIEIFECPGSRIGYRADYDWASERKDMNWLVAAPKVQVVIVGVKGTMALMTTVDPRAFILHQIWASSACHNGPVATASDQWDAQVAIKVIDQYLPQYDIADLKCLPPDVCEAIAALRGSSDIASSVALGAWLKSGDK